MNGTPSLVCHVFRGISTNAGSTQLDTDADTAAWEILSPSSKELLDGIQLQRLSYLS